MIMTHFPKRTKDDVQQMWEEIRQPI